MQMERPKVKLVRTGTDRVLDSIALGGLAALWIITIITFISLPRIIPIHFNWKGEIDNYGTKITLFMLPFIITLVVLGMTWLNKYPHIFNYPRKITPDTAAYEYGKATRLMRVIKAIISVFALVIMCTVISSSKAGHSTMKWWLLPLFVIAMIIPVVMALLSGKKRR